jgi:hypothetical protein
MISGARLNCISHLLGLIPYEKLPRQRVLFIGHLHRWPLGTPDGLLPWRGDRPVCLDATQRHLVVVHAVWDGRFALFDTKTGELIPFGET